MRDSSEVLQLFVTHRSALIDYATGIVGNRAQAEDLVQEAWLRFDETTRSRHLDQPLGYLYRIVRNLALDGHRRLKREQRILPGKSFDLALSTSADHGPTPERVALYKDELEAVMAALDELPERTRIALEMHRIGGCKLKDIAAFLDISVALAHVLVAEGVQHCKTRLGWP